MRIIALVLVVLGLAGCSFAPEYRRIEMVMPDSWTNAGQGETLERMWWKRFDDSALNALVQEALEHNRDIAAAVARVDMARARLGAARAELLPLLSGEAQASPVWVDSHKVQGSTSPYSA